MTITARNRLPWASLAIGVVCLALCGLGMVIAAPGPFLRSYLAGYSYWLGIALGSLAIVMVHRLTGGRWGLAIGRLAEAATRTLPLVARPVRPDARRRTPRFTPGPRPTKWPRTRCSSTRACI